MPTIRAFMKRHPVSLFFFILFALSWGGILLVTSPGGIPMDAEDAEELLPFLYIVMLIGPGVAGILSTGIVDGRRGMRELWSRLLRWRTGIRWYAAALLATPILVLLLLLSLSLFSPGYRPGLFTSGDTASLLLSGITAALLVGIFEEIGWTGFIIPRLGRRYGILTTGLIVGLLWGVWHFPLFWEGDSFSGTLACIILAARLFAWLPPFRVLMVWIYHRTDSLPLTMLTHASLVAGMTILVPLSLSGTHLLTWILVWGAVLWIVVAAFVPVGGLRLSGTWGTRGDGEPETAERASEDPQPSWQRITLLTILGYEGAGALAGGCLLIFAPDGHLMDMPVRIMHGIFYDFLIPGVILYGLGILNTTAFIALLRRSRADWLLAGFAMGGLAVWFIVEIVILWELHWLHAMWGLPVLAGCVLTLPLVRSRWKIRHRTGGA